MSYRIHLTICKKKDWEDFLLKFNKEEDTMYLPDISNSRPIEICNETPIDGFNAIEGTEDNEYPTYILNKDDFREILKYYQDMQIELNSERIKRVNFLKHKKYGTIKRKMWQLRRFFMIFWNYAWWSRTYFEDLKARDILISDSDRFEFQYFYLVGLYEIFNDYEDVLIITHG